MALTHIQTTPQATRNASTTIVVTFATPPALGNGILFLLQYHFYGSSPITSVTDNKGNTYTLAVSIRDVTSNGMQADVYYCAKVTATGASFAVTAAMVGDASAVAVEVGGVTAAGLSLLTTVTATGSSKTPATGTATPLAGVTTAMLVAVHAIGIGGTVCAVGSATPAWTQESEQLTSSFAAGESDTVILTSPSGVVPTCSWTWTSAGSASWAAVLAAFGDGTPTTPPDVVARTTQVALEVFNAQSATVRSTQLALEVFYPIAVPTRTTQVALEVFLASPATVRMTQHLVELFLGPPPPCTTGDFPIDPVTRAVRRWRPR
jgi:hypothetical protein